MERRWEAEVLRGATVARELDLDRGREVGKKLVNLFALVPGMESRIGDVKMADVVRMTARVPDVAVAMVRLRDLLPEAISPRW